MNYQAVKRLILKHRNVRTSFPYGKGLAVYSIDDAMFAILEVGKQPVRLSLRCDPHLAKLLRDKYEEVMPGYKLNKDKWLTIILSGQLTDDEIKDLIIHSYEVVKNET